MNTTGLFTIPPEVFRHLSFYLSEGDVGSLSETCIYLYNALNDNSVWKRFLSKKAQNLSLQSQQLNPLFEPDPDLCENLQLMSMKNHLVNNWRNQNCVEQRVESDHWFASGVHNIPKGKGQIIYQDDYVFLGRFTDDIHSDAIEVWDIRREPKLHAVIPMDDIQYDSFYIFDQALVVVVCSRVDVFEIKVESKEFPLLYSFIITEDEVVWNKPAYHVGRHDSRCVGWSYYRVDNYFISDKCEDEPYFPVLYVWDITNACKVGAFVSPRMGFSLTVHSSENEDWNISLSRQSAGNVCFFKFNVKSKKFSDTTFDLDAGLCRIHSLFYKDHLIVFSHANSSEDSEGWYDSTCEVYDMNTSRKLQEKLFAKAHKSYVVNSTTIVDGKFFMLCKNNFTLVDALSLEILDKTPCDSKLNCVTCEINVYGQMFLITSENDYALDVWDMERKNKLPTLLKCGYNAIVHVNDSKTKVVITKYGELYVKHFW